MLSYIWLFCDSMGYSLPGSFCSWRISQARILEWVAISFSRNHPDPSIETASFTLAGGYFTTRPPGKPYIINGHTFIHCHEIWDPCSLIINECNFTNIYILITWSLNIHSQIKLYKYIILNVVPRKNLLNNDNNFVKIQSQC